MIVTKTNAIRKFLIIRVKQSDFRATNSFQEFSSFDLGKLRIPRFDDQEKRVVGHPVERFMVEERMMQPRQAVQNENSEKRCKCRNQYGQLEHDREKSGNREKVHRFTMDDQWKEPGRRDELE